MSSQAPSIAPLFRSEYQVRLLGELFVNASGSHTVSELSRRTGIPQPAVSREVKRLVAHGIVTVKADGRNRYVAANEQLPWYRELRSLLAQTIGPPALLASALARVHGIEQAFIFGSWAARYSGAPGVFPHDIDVLVIGTPVLDQVFKACRAVEKELRIDVAPIVVTASEWQGADDGLISQISQAPMVEIPLGASERGG